MNNKISIESLDKDSEARWITLLSAIDTLDRFCTQNNKSFDDIDFKIPAIKHYMEDTIEYVKQLQKEDDVLKNEKSINSIRSKLAQNFFNNVITDKKHIRTLQLN
jgi:hypothetical protein